MISELCNCEILRALTIEGLLSLEFYSRSHFVLVQPVVSKPRVGCGLSANICSNLLIVTISVL